MSVNLGDLVVDTSTGFKGIAVSRHIYLTGCHRITLQPMVRRDGSLPEDKTFDEPQLKVIKSTKRTFNGNMNSGGPMPYLDRGR